LAHSFGGSCPLSIDHIVFEPMVRKHIRAGVHGGAKPLTSWSGNKRKEKKENIIHSKDLLLMT
jgi:hypothetical protein